MFSSGTSNEDVFTMQLRSMMHGEDNDKVRQTVAWTDIPYFVNHTGEIANSARKARTPPSHIFQSVRNDSLPDLSLQR